MTLRVLRGQGEARRVADDVMVREHPRARRTDGGEAADRVVDHGAEGRRIPRGLEVREVEGLVHLVGAHPEGRLLDRGEPRLGAERPVAVVLGHHLVPVAVHVVDAVLAPVRHTLLVTAHRCRILRRGVVGQPVGLHQAVRHVDTEAVDAPIEPEAQDAAELLPDDGIRPVEIGLRRVEDVQVPLTGGSVGIGRARPGGAAEHRLPVVRGQFARRALAVAEKVARTLRATGPGGERLPEPDVLVARVVRDQVDDDPDAAGMRGREHLIEVGQRAEERVDIAVVGHVVAGVLLGRGHERAQPDGVDAEALQRIEAARHSGKVADPVAVRVRERAGVDLVDDGGAPPFRPGGGKRAGRGELALGGGLVRESHQTRVLQTLALPFRVA